VDNHCLVNQAIPYDNELMAAGRIALFNPTNGMWIIRNKYRTEPDLQLLKTKPLGKSKRFLGGDGGNRTRVRKIRLSNLYEHSQLFRFVRLQINWPNCIQTIRSDPKALLAEPHGTILGSLIFMTPLLVPIRQTVPGDVTSSKEVSFQSISLCS